MQHLRQLCVVAALLCALTYSTFAGEMNGPVVPQPSPTPNSAVNADESQTTEITTVGESGEEVTTIYVIEEVAWVILQSIVIAL
jgi:hypothetical protein